MNRNAEQIKIRKYSYRHVRSTVEGTVLLTCFFYVLVGGELYWEAGSSVVDNKWYSLQGMQNDRFQYRLVLVGKGRQPQELRLVQVKQGVETVLARVPYKADEVVV